MNITQRGPLGQKAKKPAENEEYLRGVRGLPCCICEAFGEVQRTPTRSHHVCHDRFESRRTPDEMAIPLCDGHHQGGEPDKVALHLAKTQWREKYGPDHDYVAATQDKLAHLLRGPNVGSVAP